MKRTTVLVIVGGVVMAGRALASPADARQAEESRHVTGPSATSPSVTSPSEALPVEASRRPISGILFVGRWEYRDPVEFLIDGKKQATRSGYHVGLVVDPDEFISRDAPDPLVFVDHTMAISSGGPFTSASGDTFIVVQLPQVDLAKATFWLGPRELEKDVDDELVKRSWDSESRRRSLTGILSLAAVHEAEARFGAATTRSAEELEGRVAPFHDGTLRRASETIPLPLPRSAASP